MRRASVLLPKVVTFRNDLIRYGTLLTEDRNQEAEQLRAELNVQWGDLQSDLDELDIPRFWRQYSRTFPTFETALHLAFTVFPCTAGVARWSPGCASGERNRRPVV